MTYDEYTTILNAQNALLNNLESPNRVFKAIFDKQHSLHLKYGEIERANGFYAPKNDEYFVYNREQSEWIRSKFWFVTEEVSEAIMLYDATDSVDAALFYEELIDALHYIVEVSMFVGIEPNSLDVIYDSIILSDQCVPIGLPGGIDFTQEVLAEPIMWLGRSANVLKNKPWKQSIVSIDSDKRETFISHLRTAWYMFLKALITFGLTKSHVYIAYIAKNEINQSRQRNGY